MWWPVFLDEAGGEMTGFESIHHRTETLQGLGDPELGYTHLASTHGSFAPDSFADRGDLAFRWGAWWRTPWNWVGRARSSAHLLWHRNGGSVVGCGPCLTE